MKRKPSLLSQLIVETVKRLNESQYTGLKVKSADIENLQTITEFISSQNFEEITDDLIDDVIAMLEELKADMEVYRRREIEKTNMMGNDDFRTLVSMASQRNVSTFDLAEEIRMYLDTVDEFPEAPEEVIQLGLERIRQGELTPFTFAAGIMYPGRL